MEDEIMRELHQVRANLLREHGNDHQTLNTFFEELRLPGLTYGIPGRIFQTEEDLDNHIEESNREFERRQALKDATDDMCPRGSPAEQAGTE